MPHSIRRGEYCLAHSQKLGHYPHLPLQNHQTMLESPRFVRQDDNDGLIRRSIRYSATGVKLSYWNIQRNAVTIL